MINVNKASYKGNECFRGNETCQYEVQMLILTWELTINVNERV